MGQEGAAHVVWCFSLQGWVFTAEEAEEYDSLKEDFGIFEARYGSNREGQSDWRVVAVSV